MNTKEKEKSYLGRGSEVMDLEIAQARGSLIWDTSGMKYIDFLGGSGVANLGWAHKETELAIRNTERPSYVYPHFHYKGWADLAELLATITPKHLTRSFRATGGSEAVEGAMEIAMLYTGRKKFLSIEGSYHGNTLGALSLGASANRDKFHNLLSGCEKIEPPLNSETLKKVEEKLRSNEIAAFIMEPIICNLGILIPEEEFMQGLNELCRQHGTLLIMDEAITGFGRTGKLFASEHFDIKPDIVCMAKAITGGHAGMGAIITTETVGEAVHQKVGLYSSYGWHPISVDAAIATIRYLLENIEELFSNIEDISALFSDQLSQISFREPVDIRIKGLAIGVDVKDPQYASEIKKRCLKNGLLLNAEGSSLVFFPALNIERATVTEGLAILRNVCQNIEG